MKKYDAILCVDNTDFINEADRKNASRNMVGQDRYFNVSLQWDDPKLYNRYSFGQSLRSALNGLGNGWSCKVTDFNKWVVVDMQHHDIISGRTASKTVLIVFQDKGNGIVLSTHNKYRSISGVDQAISYIKNASNVLKDVNQTKI